jgi:hypothetical protein
MTIDELIAHLQGASTSLGGETEVVLMDEHPLFLKQAAPLQTPTDLRAMPDWPLPGASLLFPEEQPVKLLLLFTAYSPAKPDNDF